jgi:hypothetical protein
MSTTTFLEQRRARSEQHKANSEQLIAKSRDQKAPSYQLFATHYVLLAVLAGCGPGASSEGGAPVTMARPEASSTAPGEASTPLPLAVRPSPGDSGTRSSATPAVPDWMQSALKHPDAHVRLKALETWAQQGRQQGVSPLMSALNDPDERVRARALQLIEQDWAAEQAAGER